MLLVLLGAIVNVAVAWVLETFAPDFSRPSLTGWRAPPSGNDAAWGWNAIRFQSHCVVRIVASPNSKPMVPQNPAATRFYPKWSGWPQTLDSIASRAERPRDSIDVERTYPGPQMFEACGWPMYGMQTSWDLRRTSNDLTTGWSWGITMTRPAKPGDKMLNELRVLPLRPMWPGFAINTIFYAAVLWLLFAAPGFVRRRIRARRGQCPACGYPIGTSNVCTECGRPVRGP